ncbi:hypothetical protein [Paradevosia shaoguanensis]|uniref:Uncharacterized protein n=1 Tax=Paradevosia shaoguanensis TaxID=1335043 RepID=A0AA41QQ08_9HYPH|nr:hypothetical protein [Paradevosia shaoguanensis]MCF1744191.1 hypothetical protein [Paradevosia shaoguanensis]MCI0128674.1 hypothetical protein [Paradevosia shaoguanensis]
MLVTHPATISNPAASVAHDTELRRMVEALKELRGQGVGVSDTDLEALDFTSEQIAALGKRAVEAAREEMVIHLEPRPPYDRQKRLNFARRAIFDLCPDRLTIIACLQSNAFTHREIEDLLPEALALASDDLAGSAPRSAV